MKGLFLGVLSKVLVKRLQKYILSGLFLIGALGFEIALAQTPYQWDQPRREIMDLWRVRKEVVSIGDNFVGEKQLGQIRSVQNRFRLSDLPILSLTLLKETIQLGSSGVEDQRLQFAETFSPDLSSLDFARCRIDKLSSGIVEAIKHCFAGFQKELKYSDGKLRLFSNLIFLGINVIIFLFLAFILLLVAKYTRPFTQYWTRRFIHISPLGLIAFTVLFLFASWALGGWVICFSLLILLIWRHLSQSEKAGLIGLLIFIAAIPFAFFLPVLQLRYERDIGSILERPLYGMNLSAKAKRLESWLEHHPEDVESLFVLAQIEKQTGRYKKARELYERIPPLRPQWHKPIINLATIDYAEDLEEDAIKKLEKASSLEPRSFLAYYNLTRIYRKKMQLDQARHYLEKAKEINVALIGKLDQTNQSDDIRQFLFDESLSKEELSPRIWRITPQVVQERNQIFSAWFPMFTPMYFWAVIFLTIFFSFAIERKWPMIGSSREQEDERETEPGDQPLDVFNPNITKQIQKKYSLVTDLLPKLNKEWVTVFFPGGHLLLKGRPILSLVFMLLCLVCLLPSFLHTSFVKNPLSTPDIPSFSFATTGLVLFGFLYLGLVINAFRK